jgi:hypothetical protein
MVSSTPAEIKAVLPSLMRVVPSGKKSFYSAAIQSDPNQSGEALHAYDNGNHVQETGIRTEGNGRMYVGVTNVALPM